MDAEALITDAWRDGVGHDDRQRFAELGSGGSQGLLFAVLAEQSAGVRAVIPPMPEREAERVLHAVVVLRDGLLSDDRGVIEVGVAALWQELERLESGDPHATAARAWADLVLGEVALHVHEVEVARHRFDAVAVRPDNPIAIRLEAMRRLIGIAVERLELATARIWEQRARSLLATCDRPLQTAGLQLLGVVLSFAVRDGGRLAQLLPTLDPASAHLGRLLLAVIDRDALDGASLVTLLDEAKIDPVLYAVCLVVAVRRHVAVGAIPAAATLVEAGALHLIRHAPEVFTAFEAAVHDRILVR